VETSTVTGSLPGGDGAAPTRLHAQLVFVAAAEDASEPSAYHALEGLDEVRFRRGRRAVERDGRVLTLAFPDARMSSEHGGLVRHGAAWAVLDPRSKNGVVVDGAPTRDAALSDGAVLELGHSFFLYRQRVVPTVPARFTGDLDAAALAAQPRGLQTFSPALAHAFDQLARVARTAVSVVLGGATGTGKEIVARAIHALSARTGELVAVNCGALPSALVESELFGHKKGAFSGAVADRRGLVRTAHQGTLFLDEIAELPPLSQAAFLRVLQEREVLPVGEDRPVAVDLRLVAASLRDLDAAVEDGAFRADLHARIAGHELVLPPLAARREDLGLLLADLLPRVSPDGPRSLAASALRALLRYAWPKNIRELEKTLGAAAAIASTGSIGVDDLPAALRAPSADTAPPPSPPPPARAVDVAALDEADRALRAQLLALFAEHAGNVVAVADAMGKQRPQIYKWIRRLGIDLAPFRGAG
jgi:sigma-54 dependent transcriptional regulator, acetoin dehydrogenase operon transcriptional activator AcoR